MNKILKVLSGEIFVIVSYSECTVCLMFIQYVIFYNRSQVPYCTLKEMPWVTNTETLLKFIFLFLTTLNLAVLLKEP